MIEMGERDHFNSLQHMLLMVMDCTLKMNANAPIVPLHEEIVQHTQRKQLIAAAKHCNMQ